MTPPVTIRLLGGLSIQTPAGRVEGAGAQPRRLALLALIARAGERGITREKLLALLWPDAEPDQGRRALNQALYALRRDVGAGELLVGTHELRLDPESAVCDVLRFETALRQGRLEDAVALYEGPFLDGFRLAGAPDFDRWADDERADLAHRLEGALERLARSAAERGAPAEAVRWWRKLAALDPLDARVALALMEALVAAGEASAALQHARIYEVLIAQELDLPADSAVVALAARIRNGEVAAPAAPRLHVAPATAAEPRPAVAPAPAAPAIAAAAPAAPVPVVPGTIAVLPFEHLGDAAHAAFTEGVSEEVLHALAEVPGLAVVARSASFAFRGAGLELVDVATRLGAGLIVEGSVRHCGACVRVTARLVDVATRRPLAAERVDAVRADTGAGSSFALQDEIAARVVARVVGAVPGLAAVAGAA